MSGAQLLGQQLFAFEDDGKRISIQPGQSEHLVGDLEDRGRKAERECLAAEAAYWAAVARYNESGQSDGLMAGWQTLRDRYPESIWRCKQLFYE